MNNDISSLTIKQHAPFSSKSAVGLNKSTNYNLNVHLTLKIYFARNSNLKITGISEVSLTITPGHKVKESEKGIPGGSIKANGI